jgi:hypothetical protein
MRGGRSERRSGKGNEPMKMLSGLLTLLVFSTAASGQDCAQLEATKTKIYTFKPSSLNKTQQAAKGKELDEFWNTALAMKDAGAACVVKLLAAEPDGSFFLYDGAKLLLHMDKTLPPAKLRAAAEAMVRSDLTDVDMADYLQTVRLLDSKGIETARLADKYMQARKVDAFIPQHSLKVTKELGAVFLYGPLLPDEVDDHLAPFLQATDEETRSAAIFMLSLNLTPRSLNVLKKIRGNPGLTKKDKENIDAVLTPKSVKVKEKSKYSREQIVAKLQKFPEMDESDNARGEDKEIDNSILSTLRPEDISLFRAARRNGIKGVSDESLYRFFDLSRLLLQLINKHNLYAEERSAPAAK